MCVTLFAVSLLKKQGHGPVYQWDTARVGLWLSTIGMPRYAGVFDDAGITGRCLLALDLHDVRTLVNKNNYRQFGDDEEILEQIEDLRSLQAGYALTFCTHILFASVA